MQWKFNVALSYNATDTNKSDKVISPHLQLLESEQGRYILKISSLELSD